MRYFLPALLWGLSAFGAYAQQLPAFTQFAGCITAVDPTFATQGYGRVRCNADGSLAGAGGGGGGASGPYYVGQYNATLPTFASGQAGYQSVDSNGRVILAPTSAISVTISNQSTQTTSGALQPPTAATGKITQAQVAVAATTSTQLVGANAARAAVEIQCDGTAPVGVDRTGGTLTSATAAPLVIPSGSYPLYTMPIASLTAITAYTSTAQTCRVTEYLR